jgi:hypothetical protein
MSWIDNLSRDELAKIDPRIQLLDSLPGASLDDIAFLIAGGGLSRDNLDETGATIWMRRGGRVK